VISSKIMFSFVVVAVCVNVARQTVQMLVQAAVDFGVHLLPLTHQLCATLWLVCCLTNGQANGC